MNCVYCCLLLKLINSFEMLGNSWFYQLCWNQTRSFLYLYAVEKLFKSMCYITKSIFQYWTACWFVWYLLGHLLLRSLGNWRMLLKMVYFNISCDSICVNSKSPRQYKVKSFNFMGTPFHGLRWWTCLWTSKFVNSNSYIILLNWRNNLLWSCISKMPYPQKAQN